jgi:hypothetical protein
MVKKIRDNASFIKRSLEKISDKIEETRKAVERNNVEQAEKELKEKQKLEQLKKIETILESLEELSYNDLRKYASEVGIIIYQRTKEHLKEDLRNYYEQCRSETYQLFGTQDVE